MLQDSVPPLFVKGSDSQQIHEANNAAERKKPTLIWSLWVSHINQQCIILSLYLVFGKSCSTSQLQSFTLFYNGCFVLGLSPQITV